jgi:hypothetical protein
MIGIHRIFLINVATFSVTNRSISPTKTEIDFFKTFLLIFKLLLKNVGTAKLFREFWGTQYT